MWATQCHKPTKLGDGLYSLYNHFLKSMMILRGGLSVHRMILISTGYPPKKKTSEKDFPFQTNHFGDPHGLWKNGWFGILEGFPSPFDLSELMEPAPAPWGHGLCSFWRRCRSSPVFCCIIARWRSAWRCGQGRRLRLQPWNPWV